MLGSTRVSINQFLFRSGAWEVALSEVFPKYSLLLFYFIMWLGSMDDLGVFWGGCVLG